MTNNTFKFYRGYTGHEHLPEFSLINMNGRVYDPVLGRFLSPDLMFRCRIFRRILTGIVIVLIIRLSLRILAGNGYW
ncbi:RHS repeat-associated core domain-containing protein [Viscerimonas tarda]